MAWARPFHMPPRAAPDLDRRLHGEAGVERPDQPAGPGPTAASGGRSAASAGSAAPSAPRPRAPGHAPGRRRTSPAAARPDRSAAMPTTVPASSQRRIAELGVGRARDHPADLADACVGPQADRVRSGRARSAPAPSCSAPRAQSSMISPRIAAMPPAASSASRRTSMQPPAAAGVCWRGSFTQANGIEHVEEEDEGRDQQPLGRSSRSVQPRHQRGQRQPPASARGDQPAQIVRARGRCRRR